MGKNALALGLKTRPPPNHRIGKMNMLDIGWREWVTLPELGNASLRAKIDTGARTSALHAHNLRLEKRDGKTFAHFVLMFSILGKKQSIELCREVVALREIKSSNGETEIRPVIHTLLRMGNVEWDVDVTLTDRSMMKFNMLVGREALGGRVRINPARSYVLGNVQRS